MASRTLPHDLIDADRVVSKRARLYLECEWKDVIVSTLEDCHIMKTSDSQLVRRNFDLSMRSSVILCFVIATLSGIPCLHAPSHYGIYSCNLNVATSKGRSVISIFPFSIVNASSSSSKIFVFQTCFTSSVVTIVPLLLPPRLS